MPFDTSHMQKHADSAAADSTCSAPLEELLAIGKDCLVGRLREVKRFRLAEVAKNDQIHVPHQIGKNLTLDVVILNSSGRIR